MRRALRTIVALAVISGWAFADDVRNFRPDTYWIPGWLEGDYASESVVILLPDVIEATLESLTPVRTIDNLTPVRTLEKL